MSKDLLREYVQGVLSEGGTHFEEYDAGDEEYFLEYVTRMLDMIPAGIDRENFFLFLDAAMEDPRIQRAIKAYGVKNRL